MEEWNREMRGGKLGESVVRHLGGGGEGKGKGADCRP